MRSMVMGKIQDDKRIGGWGECFYPIRTVFVDCSKRLEPETDKRGNYMYRMSHINPYTNRFVSKVMNRKRTYRSYLEVLVEELVHYRFAYFQEGKKLQQRIREVLRGRVFEPKHVHLFSHMSKNYRRDIDVT